MDNFDENRKGGCFKALALCSGLLALILNPFTSCGKHVVTYTDDIARLLIRNGDELIAASDDVIGYIIKKGDEWIIYTDDVAGYVIKNGDKVVTAKASDDVIGYVIKNGDELIAASDDVTGYIIKKGNKLVTYTDDVARSLKVLKRYSLGGSEITRYADDVIVIRKPNGELVIGRSPSHHIVPQFNSFTPFEKLDDATINAFQQSAERAAIDAVNQALSADISQVSLEIFAEEAAKRAIMKDIIIRQKINGSFVIISTAQLNKLANQSVKKALEVKESETSYINMSYGF